MGIGFCRMLAVGNQLSCYDDIGSGNNDSTDTFSCLRLRLSSKWSSTRSLQTGRTSLATRSGRFPVIRIYGGTFECIHKSHALLTLLPYIQTGTWASERNHGDHGEKLSRANVKSRDRRPARGTPQVNRNWLFQHASASQNSQNQGPCNGQLFG